MREGISLCFEIITYKALWIFSIFLNILNTNKFEPCFPYFPFLSLLVLHKYEIKMGL